jgi:hypothetical protein
MDNMKNLKKVWMSSLSILDNSYVNTSICIILVLYCSTIFDNINAFIGNLYNYSIVKIIVLLLIVYISHKDTNIAILLAMSYLISISYMVNTENFSSKMAEEEGIYKKNNKKIRVGVEVEEENKSRSRSRKEHFFPMMTENTTTFEENKPNKQIHSTRTTQSAQTSADCMLNYTPTHESVGNVCTPVATFQNELNAQGLNFPEGFDFPGANGSPIN